MADQKTGVEGAEELAFFEDCEPAVDDFRAAVLDGLARTPKGLPPKFFYDDAGAALFEAITETEEYYITRTEIALLRRIADDIAALVGPGSVVVEPGSGASIKIRTLLDHLVEPAGYVAIDISRGHLLDSVRRIAHTYPALAVGAICADFMQAFDLPPDARTLGRRRLGFFPGSTIGNFAPDSAVGMLTRFRDLIGPGGGLVIGVDLKKDARILNAAYNDAAGITADFNLNLLRRINRELGGDIDLCGFEHIAFYNEAEGRVEMHLKSRRRQTVHVAGRAFGFDEGETIHTENSYKYDRSEFAALAARAGFDAVTAWADDRGLFSIHYLAVPQ